MLPAGTHCRQCGSRRAATPAAWGRPGAAAHPRHRGPPVSAGRHLRASQDDGGGSSGSGAPSQPAAASSSSSASTSAAPGYAPHVKAALFTGSYAVVAGLALAVAPKLSFGLLFDATSVPSGWIRVGGILFALIGSQYLGTAWHDAHGGGADGFYWTTVWSRVALAVAFGALVATGQSPPGLLVLAALNLAGAVSMLLALRRRPCAAG